MIKSMTDGTIGLWVTALSLLQAGVLGLAAFLHSRSVAHGEIIKGHTAEIDNLKDWKDTYSEDVGKRLERLEGKIDRLIERGGPR